MQSGLETSLPPGRQSLQSCWSLGPGQRRHQGRDAQLPTKQARGLDRPVLGNSTLFPRVSCPHEGVSPEPWSSWYLSGRAGAGVVSRIHSRWLLSYPRVHAVVLFPSPCTSNKVDWSGLQCPKIPPSAPGMMKPQRCHARLAHPTPHPPQCPEAPRTRVPRIPYPQCGYLGIHPWRLAGSAPRERAEEETCRRSRANSPGRLRAAGRSVRCGNGARGEQGSVGTTDAEPGGLGLRRHLRARLLPPPPAAPPPPPPRSSASRLLSSSL